MKFQRKLLFFVFSSVKKFVRLIQNFRQHRNKARSGLLHKLSEAQRNEVEPERSEAELQIHELCLRSEAYISYFAQIYLCKVRNIPRF